MMSIVYINGSAARSALIFKPTERSRKVRYVSADFFMRNIAKVTHGKRRKRIIYIMVTGDAELHSSARTGACVYIKGIKSFFVRDFLRRIIAFRVGNAECDRKRKIRRDFFRNRVVPADNRRRHFRVRGKRQVREFVKRRLYLIYTGKIVRMVDINIQYDGDCREHIKERILIFARLENEVATAAEAVRAAHFLRFRPAHNRRVKPLRDKHVRYHGRNGRFAVHARNAYAPFIATHYPAEKVGAIYKRKTLRLCCGELGIIIAYGAVIYDGVTARNIFGLVLRKDGNSLRFQFFRYIGGRTVGAGNRITFSFTRQSKRGHIYPAYAYKKQPFYALHCFGNFA